MFLDDQLLEVGRKIAKEKFNTGKYVKEMIELCLDNMGLNLSELSTSIDVVNTFKRIHTTWQKVALQLEEEGDNTVLPEGFKNYIEKTKPKLYKELIIDGVW